MSHKILIGDVIDRLRELPDESVHCVVTSPPYLNLRNYNVDGQIGLEKTPEEFIARLVSVFREVRRVLRSDGTVWCNMGDSYARDGGEQGGGNRELMHLEGTQKRLCKSPYGYKSKDLMGIPWLLAFALRADGWWLRSDMPWVKRSSMPESVTDRPAKALEYVFLLTKSERYFFDMEAVKKAAASVGKPMNFTAVQSDAIGRKPSGNQLPENYNKPRGSSRNFRNADMWFESISAPHGMCFLDDEIVGLDVNPQPTPDAHFATFPEALVRPCILAGTSEKGVCPHCGKPWVRTRQKTADVSADHKGSRFANGKTSAHQLGLAQEGDRFVTVATGWRPDCCCGQPGVIPATVLDPFLGSGTTLAVAKKLGRNGVGCELNPDYALIAQRKIDRARIGQVPKPMKPAANQISLF